MPLLIELPEYKIPNFRTVAIYVWEKIKDYLTKAGTTIFLASIIPLVCHECGTGGIHHKRCGQLCRKIRSDPGAGIKTGRTRDWQIAVALISGISAKEVVVSSMSVLYGIGNINSAAGMAELSGILEKRDSRQ